MYADGHKHLSLCCLAEHIAFQICICSTCSTGAHSSAVYFQVKAYLADPSAFASAAPEAGAGGDSSAPAAEKEAEKPAEEEEESDEDMGFSLFD